MPIAKLSALERDVVVVGASTGGLEAVRRIAAALPEDFDAAILVVLRGPADAERPLDALIGDRARLRARYAKDGETLRRGRIYVAPPDRHLTVEQPGVLRLRAAADGDAARPRADLLFESAARVFGRRVIGVVLTGGDHDGTRGLQAIGAAGGVGIVQSPVDAANPEMPVSALIGDSPDHVALLDEMSGLLLRLAGAGKPVGDRAGKSGV